MRADEELDEAAVNEVNAEDGEAAGSEDPCMPKMDVPAEERTESPPKPHKQCTDSEPTKSDVSQYMKSMLEGKNSQLKRLETRFELHAQRADVVDRNYQNLLERMDNVELMAGTDDRLQDNIGEMEKNMRAEVAAASQKLTEMTKKEQQQQQHTKAAAAAAPQSTWEAGQDHIVIVNGFQRETPKGQLEMMFEK